MSLYAYLTVLFIIIGIYVFYKRRSIREGLDTCTGKADGCYQYQAAGNLVPARTDTAPGGTWKSCDCTNTRLLASGKWCGPPSAACGLPPCVAGSPKTGPLPCSCISNPHLQCYDAAGTYNPECCGIGCTGCDGTTCPPAFGPGGNKACKLPLSCGTGTAAMGAWQEYTQSETPGTKANGWSRMISPKGKIGYVTGKPPCAPGYFWNTPQGKCYFSACPAGTEWEWDHQAANNPSYADPSKLPDCLCKAKGCTVPSSLGDGVVGGDTTPCGASAALTSGGKCSIKCAAGYLADAGTTEYSCDKGTLTSATLKCAKPKNCSLPSSLGTGVAGGDTTPCGAGSSLTSGGKCSIKCAAGYLSDTGTTEYGCNNGSLTAATLKCTEPKGCTLPSPLGAGAVAGDTMPCSAGVSLTSGDKCSIKCAPGYNADSGNTMYSCDNGALTGPTLKCTKPKGCTLPSSLGAGTVGGDTTPCSSGGALTSGAKCNIKCAAGYNADSGTTAYSCSNGSLSAATLKCTKPKGCTIPSSLGMGAVGGDTTPCSSGGALISGAKCNIKCAAGYNADSGTTAYSCSNGSLSAATLKCAKPKVCTMPSSLGDGVAGMGASPCIDSAVLGSGKACDVECEPGYKKLSGTTAYSCNNGELTRGTLQCGPISCKIPASLGKGIRAAPFKGCAPGDSLGAGKSCSVDCETGYKAYTGAGTYSCNSTGVLSKATLECNPVTCKLPQPLGENVVSAAAEGCIAGKTILGGTKCNTSCAKGYKQQGGSGLFSCGEDGILDTGDLKCRKEKIKAPTPMQINEDIVLQNITFVCDPDESPQEIPEHRLARPSHSFYSPAPLDAYQHHIIPRSETHRVPSSKSVRFPGMAKVQPYDSLMNW